MSPATPTTVRHTLSPCTRSRWPIGSGRATDGARSFADDHDLRRVLPVGLEEAATAADGNAEGTEVLRVTGLEGRRR